VEAAKIVSSAGRDTMPLRKPNRRLDIDMGSLRILIVDDSETTRRVVGTILRSRHWTICGEAENGRTGVEKFQELKPDVVLLDLSMPDMTGIEAAQQMSAADPKVPLILFTILEIEGIGNAAREAGIRAIVPKSEAWSLVASIERIANQQAS
jgi:CheY-like chemotaxis protein